MSYTKKEIDERITVKPTGAPECPYYGWIEGVNGIVADGGSFDKVRKTLHALYRAKLKFDLRRDPWKDLPKSD